MYIHLNKKDNSLKPYGSLKSLCKNNDLKIDNFYTHFGRKGNSEFENEFYRIVKADVIRS